MFTLRVSASTWFAVNRGNSQRFQELIYGAFTNPLKTFLATANKPTSVDGGTPNWFNSTSTNNTTDNVYQNDNNENYGFNIYFPLGGFPNMKKADYRNQSTFANLDNSLNKLENAVLYNDGGIKLPGDSFHVLLARIPAVEYLPIKDEIGFKYLTLDIAKTFIDVTKENPLDTPNIKKFNKALEMLNVKEWSPTRDTETFVRTYGLNLDEPDSNKQILRVGKVLLKDALNGSYTDYNGHTVIKPLMISDNGSYNTESHTVYGVKNLYDTVVVIPRLKNNQSEINAHLVYKTIADRLVTDRPAYHQNPYNRGISRTNIEPVLYWASYMLDWSNTFNLPPVARNWYYHDGNNTWLNRVTPIFFASQFKDPSTIGVTDHMYDGFTLDNEENHSPFRHKLQASTYGRYIKQRSNLLFHMEDNSDYGGNFVWEAPDDHNFFTGSVSVPYIYANSIHPNLLLNPSKTGVAFLPAMFGSNTLTEQVLPVNKKEVSTQTTTLSAANTDEVRRQLWDEFFAKSGITIGGNATPEFSDELFDKFIDAPKTALPYMYNEEDLQVGGKYRQHIVPEIVKSLTPSYSYHRTGDYGSQWHTIELSLPYTSVKLPEGKDGNKWAGLGHVIPFESVYFPIKVGISGLKSTRTFDHAHMMVTRHDYGVTNTSSDLNVYYTGENQPVYLSSRFDLDHIYTPIQSGYLARVSADDNKTIIFKGHKSNLPSIHLTGVEEDGLKNLHMLVPPRVLANDGNPTVTRYHNTLEAYKTESVRTWVPRALYGNSKPIQYFQHDHGGFDPTKDTYLREVSRFNMKGENGKLVILDPDVTTKTKTDVFFNNRIVSHDVLDEIRKGRHFANYAMVNETVVYSGINGVPLNYFQEDLPENYGSRYKNWVDPEMRKYFNVTDVNNEVPYLRDVKPLAIKDDVEYLSSDGLSMILKPGDYTRAFVNSRNELAPHAEQAANTITLKRWYNNSVAPLQDPAHTNSWLDMTPYARNPNLYAAKSAYAGKVDEYAGYAYWGTTDQPWSYHSNLARHIKASQDLANPDVNGKVISTTASYLLSFLFKQARLNINTEDLGRNVGHLAKDATYTPRVLSVSSLFWYDEEKVAQQMRKASNVYGGVALMSGIISERTIPTFYNSGDTTETYFRYAGDKFSNPYASDNLYNYEFALPLMHQEEVNRGSVNFMADGFKNERIGLSHSFVNMYDSFLPQAGAENVEKLKEAREELNSIIRNSHLMDEARQQRKEELEKMLADVEIPMHEQMMYHNRLRIFEFDATAQIYGKRLSGEFNGELLYSSNVMMNLPSYVKNDTMRVYNNYNTPMVRETPRTYGTHFLSPRGNITSRKEAMDVVDMTTAFKMKNPITQTTTAITGRVWEPTDLIIPTTLVEDGHWENPADWVKVAGYEETNTYALMDMIEVGAKPLMVGQVRSYPVTVPIMYRKPKQAFDLMMRLANPGGGLLSGTIDWFDVLANDTPFIFTFYVADIAFLIQTHCEVKTEMANKYDANTNTWFKPGVDVSSGLSDDKADELRKEIAAFIGISPVLLKVTHENGVTTVQCTDEYIQLGLPMFAGYVNVEFGDKPTNMLPVAIVSTTHQTPKGSTGTGFSTDAEIIQYANVVESTMQEQRNNDKKSDERKRNPAVVGEGRWVMSSGLEMAGISTDGYDSAMVDYYGMRQAVYFMPVDLVPNSSENPRAAYHSYEMSYMQLDDGKYVNVYSMMPNFYYNPYDEGTGIGDEE